MEKIVLGKDFIVQKMPVSAHWNWVRIQQSKLRNDKESQTFLLKIHTSIKVSYFSSLVNGPYRLLLHNKSWRLIGSIHWQDIKLCQHTKDWWDTIFLTSQKQYLILISLKNLPVQSVHHCVFFVLIMTFWFYHHYINDLLFFSGHPIILYNAKPFSVSLCMTDIICRCSLYGPGTVDKSLCISFLLYW